MPSPSEMVLDRYQRCEAREDDDGADHQVVAKAELPGHADLRVHSSSHDEQREEDHGPYYC